MFSRTEFPIPRDLFFLSSLSDSSAVLLSLLLESQMAEEKTELPFGVKMKLVASIPIVGNAILRLSSTFLQVG